MAALRTRAMAVHDPDLASNPHPGVPMMDAKAEPTLKYPESEAFYAEALRELKTVRRMTGRPDHLPVMADCERALGRPERALSLARDPAAATLDAASRAELAIVTAGARRDRGEFDAAVSVLEGAELRTKSRAEWVARLRYAYADALLAAGRDADALEWFHRAAAVDGQGSTDALERAEALQRNSGQA